MKESCEYYMNQYLMLDKGERLGRKLTAHLLKCQKCKEEVIRFSHAERVASDPIKIPTHVDMDQVRQIMNQVDPDYKPKVHRVSMGIWIFFGLFLLIALVSMGSMSISSKIIGFYFYISFACVVIAYFVAFFACNLDFIIKRLHVKLSV